MGRDMKTSVVRLLLLISIVPLFIFAFIFFGQTFQFFMNNDTENIKSVLEREQKYLEYLVEVNIKEMKVVSTSDNIKTRKLEEIIEVFSRIMRVRDDFHKMKYVRRDGYTVEVFNGGRHIEYTKNPLAFMERTFMENGEYAMYSGRSGEGQYLVFSAPFTTEQGIEAVILGYLPADRLNFITSNINLNAVGNIFLKDSRDEILLQHGDGLKNGKIDMEYKIQNTDWSLAASVDYSYFKNIIYENILIKLVIFLILVVIFIVPFAIYSGNYMHDSIGEIVQSMKSLRKIEDNDKLFYKIEENNELRKSFNKMIDIVNDNVRFDNSEAYVDKLTGLYNKIYIEERLSRDIYERTGESIYFIMIEISSANGIKDSSGSLICDVCIYESGDIIRETIRFRDIAVRFDEGKFLVVLRGIEHQKVMSIASRLRDLIKNRVCDLEENHSSFSVNIGIAKYNNDIYKTISSSERALNDSKFSRNDKIVYRES